MEIYFGKGTTEYGPGVQIDLSEDELYQAIAAYLVARGINISGPRTTRPRSDGVGIYVDPSGHVNIGDHKTTTWIPAGTST